MVDADLRPGGEGGFRAKGNAEPGGSDHVEVVRPVADRQRRFEGKAMVGRQPKQRVEFRLTGDDRRHNAAGESSLDDLQLVADLLFDAEQGGDRAGEIAKAT